MDFLKMKEVDHKSLGHKNKTFSIKRTKMLYPFNSSFTKIYLALAAFL